MILVGDPQQLPATVFVSGDRARLYERSLFERLQQAGQPVVMLTTQYRMHSAIRTFPSRFFYNDALVDSERVLGDEWNLPYHTSRRFQPYLFYDLRSRETKRGRSLRNRTEAEFVVQLLTELLLSFGNLKPPPLTSCAVITPYREQLQEVSELLAVRSRSDVRFAALQGVEVSTVDGFQGREKDIIVYSCVRAGSGRIGFVKDVRRMNVAITRARYALWVVGDALTLRSSPAWRALIEDARLRKCFVSDVDASRTRSRRSTPPSGPTAKRKRR